LIFYVIFNLETGQRQTQSVCQGPAPGHTHTHTLQICTGRHRHTATRKR